MKNKKQYHSQPLLLTSMAIIGLTGCSAANNTADGKSAVANVMADNLEFCKTLESIRGVCPTGEHAKQTLCQPKTYKSDPSSSLLDMKMTVRFKEVCVPTPVSSTSELWKYSKIKLRTYGVKGAGDDDYTFGHPGPTFILNRKINGIIPGGEFHLELLNQLGQGGSTTDEHNCQIGTAMAVAGDSHRIPGFKQTDKTPNCFHGNNNTNFHYHGFHISPQPTQDYVLLNIFPEGTLNNNNVFEYQAGSTTVNELLDQTKTIGGYKYELDPLPANQAEGTHWYHAHKHGATALQLANGMAGTFIVKGPFDYSLETLLPDYKDRLMVLQSIGERVNSRGAMLTNGQYQPEVPIAPGEIQRWRFVNANAHSSADITINFNDFGSYEVKQIAMDGVQFSPENIRKQPLDYKDGTLHCPGSRSGWLTCLRLSPGNRADVLVKAPEDVIPGSKVNLGYRVLGNLGEVAKKALKESGLKSRGKHPRTNEEILGANLFALRVTGPLQAMNWPNDDQWPSLPPFLQWDPADEPTNEVEFAYNMTKASGLSQTETETAIQIGVKTPPQFEIDGKAFEGVCVRPKFSVPRQSKQKWTVTNTLAGGYSKNSVEHPLHIHTNPFLVKRNGDQDFGEGIWQDVIRLPASDVGEGDLLRKNNSVELWMTFDDYTGLYVQHCHILGHEDRGMMALFQTTCEGGTNYGTPLIDQEDNCAQPPPMTFIDTCDELTGAKAAKKRHSHHK